MARVVNEQDYATKRAEIVDVAQRLIYTKGYQQMAIQDILDALQISKGAFYHYFDSKQALLEALIERMVDSALQILNPIVEDPHLPALEKLLRYFDTAVRWKTTQKTLMLQLLRVWYADENSLVRQKLFSETVKQITPSFSAIIQQGIQEGVFSPAYPDQVGGLLFSMQQTMGDMIAEVFLAPEPQPGDLDRLIRGLAAITDAMERVLGAPSGSIQIMDPELWKEWVPVAEPTPSNGNE